jgi:hypothetical protein
VPERGSATHNHTGGIRQNLFEIYYFEKLRAPRARGACPRARALREVNPRKKWPVFVLNFLRIKN